MTDPTDIESRLVWILGSPRSGSTWLMALLGVGDDVRMINEPGIGIHLGAMLGEILPIEPAGKPSSYRLDQFRRNDENYFFAPAAEGQWREPLRDLIAARFGAQLGDRRWAVIKEPNGSHGAEALLAAMPASRLIFLLRDGRDVIDSMLDAVTGEGWLIGMLDGFEPAQREAAIRSQAYLWLWRTEAVQRAYSAHAEDLRILVRYEELLRDPEPILEELAAWLGLDPAPILELAERTDVEKSNRAPGKFIRAARPGLWREHFDTSEQELIESIIGEKLRELGYSDS